MSYEQIIEKINDLHEECDIAKEQKAASKITSNDKQFVKEGRDAFYFLREQAKTNKIQDMTLDEINKEINDTGN